MDDRECRSGLPDALARHWPRVAVARLPVGDVEIGPRVIVERKTADDFITSILDQRLFAQCWSLVGVGRRPLLIVEGRDGAPFLRVPPRHLRGALLAVTVSYRVPLLRTDDVEETALTLAQLAEREQRSLARRLDRPVPTPGRVAVDILGSIPGVGDLRARRLIDRFGSLAAVVTAEDDALLDVSGVGKSTVKRIREVTQARAESRPFGPYDSGGAGDGTVSEAPPPRRRGVPSRGSSSKVRRSIVGGLRRC